MQGSNVSGNQKTVSEIKCYLSATIERPMYLATITSVCKIRIFNIPLTLNKFMCTIMTVMKKLKFMQEFPFAFNEECLDV